SRGWRMSRDIFMACSWVGLGRQVAAEPVHRELGHLLECARLLEKMRRARDRGELARAAHLRVGLAVELEHVLVALADDEQRGRGDSRQCRPRKVRTP